MKCNKCKDTGWIPYDDNHKMKCPYCCKHDKGWWKLTENYSGYIEGGDNRCCKAGCGTKRRDMKNNYLKIDSWIDLGKGISCIKKVYYRCNLTGSVKVKIEEFYDINLSEYSNID